MKVKEIVSINFQDYYLPSIFIATAQCTWKCCTDCGRNICQNLSLASAPTFDIPNSRIVNMWRENDLAQAIVFGGLEPFDQFDELINLIAALRKVTEADIVIYTGYTEDECAAWIPQLQQYKKIIVKFGRYIPDQEPIFDTILGINLASKNQYAKRISE